jgi:hypothetical protein
MRGTSDGFQAVRGRSLAMQSEVEFEAAVKELIAAGIDRAGISFFSQEEIAAS